MRTKIEYKDAFGKNERSPTKTQTLHLLNYVEGNCLPSRPAHVGTDTSEGTLPNNKFPIYGLATNGFEAMYTT